MAFCGGWCPSSGVGESERERELLIAESAERESLFEMSAAWTEDGGEGPGARGQGPGLPRVGGSAGAAGYYSRT